MLALIFGSLPLILIALWLLAIRPYALRNGRGYTPGANMGITFWVDWQEASEIARLNNDRNMIWICRLVLVLQIALMIAIIMMMAGFGIPV